MYSFSPGSVVRPERSHTVMAGDGSTELLFLDTFKHQNSEVVILALLSGFFYVCLKYASSNIMLKGFESTVLNFPANVSVRLILAVVS